jgi:hypothetical protein
VELKEKAVSKKQQRFFGMVRAAQKGEGAASPEVAKVAGEISKKDAKDFAKTKHKGLPEKKEVKEGASIIQGRRSSKKSSYRGPTGDHKRDEHGHIVASHYNKTKTEYLVASPKKGKKKKGPIDWQKTKKKNKTIKAQHLANKKKKKESRERAASVNEEKLLEKFGQWKQAVKNRDKAHKKPNRKAPKQGSIKSRVKKGVGRVPLKDVNAPAEKQSMQGVGGFRGVHGASRKSKAAQGKPAPVVYSYKKKVSEGLSVKDAKKLNKAAALDQSDDPKKQDRARARRTEVDYKDLLRQIKKRRGMKEDWKPEIEHSKLGDAVKKKREKKRKEAESSLPPHLKLDAMKKAFAHTNEQNELAGKWKIDSSAHKKVQKKAKLRNLAKGNTNPNEKAAAQKKAGGPKLYGEGRSFADWKKAAGNALKRKKEERKAQPATDAGARARRKLKDKEHNKYVNFLPAEDD